MVSISLQYMRLLEEKFEKFCFREVEYVNKDLPLIHWIVVIFILDILKRNSTGSPLVTCTSLCSFIEAADNEENK